MPKYNFSYYAKRLWTLGLLTACMLIYYRLKKAYFKLVWQHKKKIFLPIATQETKPLSVTILGFGTHTFANATSIDWHSDFFTTGSPTNWATAFFANITIPHNQQLKTPDNRLPDIKVPWELSRLHCLYGQPIQTVLTILSSWMVNNPFPYGVNWLNPMEVGIRAINIMKAVKMHAGAPEVSATVMIQLHELLTYHAYFIEHCWEVSDKPNNHYLADLVGYLHLCCFLDITKYYRKRHRAWRWVQQAFKEQLLADGTCYEGSTAYHKLVTELFDLALACAEEYELPINPQLYQMQKQMHAFISDCTDQAGNLVLIGDDDSGIIYPVTPKQKKSTVAPVELRHDEYPNFGLTIIKNKRCMLTHRHASKTPKQPTGHFHRDEHAITLSIDGIAVFIDPGTYLYTAQPAWRNALRAASAHTTVIPAAHTAVPSDLDLFQLPQATWGQTIISRHCQLNKDEIIITDTISSAEAINWYWHIGPSIEIQAVSEYTWLLLHKQQPLAQIQSSLPLHVQHARASTAYGSYKPTTILSGSAQAQQSNKMLQQCRIVLMR